MNIKFIYERKQIASCKWPCTISKGDWITIKKYTYTVLGVEHVIKQTDETHLVVYLIA